MRDSFDPTLEGPVQNLWRYAPLLPVRERRVALGAGGTPLLEAPTLSAELDVTVQIKDETGNPTGSIKDRGSAVVVNRALAAGRDTVACASTGNAAASLAGYAARAGLDCRIFVPEHAPEAKTLQPLVYGAQVYAVEGSYDDAYALCQRASDEREWYTRSGASNPFAVEGKRTAGHEIADQSRQAVPDWVVVSMGNGGSISGTWRGLREFRELGYVDDTPRMLGVQATGASAIYDQFTGRESDGAATTRADSIAVGTPHSASAACRALEESGGDAVTVSDDAIVQAAADLGRDEGVYAEPAGAAPLAGLRVARERGIVDRGDHVVLLVTGNGLKDAASAEAVADEIRTVPADAGTLPD
ncbi:MAG: threonine synthase [Haloarculaceae archaeon]